MNKYFIFFTMLIIHQLSLTSEHQPQTQNQLIAMLRACAQSQPFDLAAQLQWPKHIQYTSYWFIDGTPCQGIPFSTVEPHAPIDEPSGQHYNTIIKPSTHAQSLGLFAQQNIPTDTLLFPYTGKIIRTKKTGSNKAYALKITDDDDDNEVSIDAETMGNESRFINHSFDPNTTVKLCIKNGLLQPWIATTTPIKNGEELTSNYGTRYWKAFKKIPNESPSNKHIVMLSDQETLNAYGIFAYANNKTNELVIDTPGKYIELETTHKIYPAMKVLKEANPEGYTTIIMLLGHFTQNQQQKEFRINPLGIRFKQNGNVELLDQGKNFGKEKPLEPYFRELLTKVKKEEIDKHFKEEKI